MLRTTLTFGAFAWLLFISIQSFGQSLTLEEELAALDAELDDIFANEEDSLSLLSLIDGLMAGSTYSELQTRIAYTSRVTSAGRDIGLDQQGLAPGISYYHKSGWFGDVSGFWSNDLEPNYNFTIGSIGYQGQFKKNITYSLMYDHTFYTQDSELNTLKNTTSASISYFLNHAYSSLDYSFSFGEETAHRVIWSLTGNIRIRKVGPIDRISILPSFSLLFGNENVINQYVQLPPDRTIDRAIIFVSNLPRGGANVTDLGITRFANNNDFTFQQAEAVFNAAVLVNEGTLPQSEVDQYLEPYFTTDAYSQTFELLNYYLSIPVVLYKGNFSLRLSYNYNIPRSVSDDIAYEPNGYFGAGISYRFKL